MNQREKNRHKYLDTVEGCDKRINLYKDLQKETGLSEYALGVYQRLIDGISKIKDELITTLNEKSKF